MVDVARRLRVLMPYWSEFLMVAGAHLLAVASPGPDFAIVVRQSITRGRRAAIATSLGIGTGILVHVGYSLLGIGVVVAKSELWFNVLKYVGAAYLAWLGIQSLRASSVTLPAKSEAAEDAGRARGAFMTGFLVNVLNPKAALFFIALFVTVISPSTPRTMQAAYGLWMVCATAAWFTLVSCVFTRPGVREKFLRLGHWFDRVMGVLLLALAARLAVTSW
jgi:RhtB (resistance to homoserine/threonine) family protein